MSPLTEAAHCCVRKLLQHSPRALQSGIHHSTAKSPLKSWGCISSTGCCQETSSSTYPVSAQELPQVKTLSPPATCHSVFAPSSANSLSPQWIWECARCLCTQQGWSMGRSKWLGKWPHSSPLQPPERELIPCKEQWESWSSRGGGEGRGWVGVGYTNLSTSCFLPELAQQKAIFRLKCFKLQWA